MMGLLGNRAEVRLLFDENKGPILILFFVDQQNTPKENKIPGPIILFYHLVLKGLCSVTAQNFHKMGIFR
jgi:hypothetical protein